MSRRLCAQRLRANMTDPPTRLPHVRHEQWGLTVAIDEATLAARLIVPSPSGRYPPMHPATFDRRYEFVAGGNVGAVIFRAYFTRLLAVQNVEYSPHAIKCALRHLLRPTAEVRNLVAAIRPPVAMTTRLIGVHIRSEAHLLNRGAHNEGARYELRSASTAGSSGGVFAADRVFAGCAVEKDGVSHRHLANYSEFWLAALAATRSWRQVQRDAQVRWLVVSDSAALKRQAQTSWPQLVATTNVQPTQAGACDPSGSSAATHRDHVLRTVAELLLLSEAHVLVLGRSRFPMAALLLSGTCRESHHLFLDKRCRRRQRGRTPRAADIAFAPEQLETYATPEVVAIPTARRPGHRMLQCFGASAAYSARSLQEPDGSLEADPILNNF
jgi:hypothetical protein